ncbi:MAG: transcription elongation factor GreA [Chloroflexi bacterium]|nr:MAG: transcription elongation factor GreA [Phototrophicales bacterium]RMF79628.1 MAG: transcription elongation factor GreA [Chloroflexota bacterium]
MADEKTYLTPEGAEDLRRELDQLINVRRPALATKLKEAIAEGDLKENANYHDAKEQQAFVEGRIQYLENVLRSAEIISNDGSTDEVRLGSQVTIREDGESTDETYTIVGAAEANPREGKISHESPIGAALLGRKKGDKVKVATPGGEVIFKIRKIN